MENEACISRTPNWMQAFELNLVPSHDAHMVPEQHAGLLLPSALKQACCCKFIVIPEPGTVLGSVVAVHVCGLAAPTAPALGQWSSW